MAKFTLVLISLVALVSCSASSGSIARKGLIEKNGVYVHRVRHSGESVSLISMWYTGKISNWRKILAANPKIDPKRIEVGDSIRIPKRLVSNNSPLTKNKIRELNRKARSAALAKKKKTVVVAKKPKKRVKKKVPVKPEEIKVVKKIDIKPPKVEPIKEEATKAEPPKLEEPKIDLAKIEEAKVEKPKDEKTSIIDQVLAVEDIDEPEVAEVPVEPEIAKPKMEEPEVVEDVEEVAEAKQPTPEDIEREKLLKELLGE